MFKLLSSATLAAFAFSAGPALAGESAASLDVLAEEEAWRTCGYEPGDEVVVFDGRLAKTAGELAELMGDTSNIFPVVSGVDFSGQDLAGHDFPRTCFYAGDFTNTHWDGLYQVRFRRSDLQGADFSNARLQSVSFVGTSLKGANLAGASLQGGEFVGAFGNGSLEETDFSDAKMEGFRFECGITVDAWCWDSYRARFTRADLTRANLSSLGVWDRDQTVGTRLNQTIVAPRSVPYFAAAQLDGEVILRAQNWGGELPEQEELSVAVAPGEFRALVVSNAAVLSDNPSFDCAKSGNTAEKLVCGEWNGHLRAKDRDIARLYAEARVAGVATAREQREWLAKRNRCNDAECIAQEYDSRMDKLFAALGDRLILAPDQSVTYYDETLPLADELRDTPLYGRILPVLKDAASQSIRLTGMEDGSVSARGDALGANAHICDMFVPDARFDPANGWYSATLEDGTKVPLFRVWGDRLMMRYSGNLGDTPDEAQRFISCGARASFLDGRRLDP